MRAFGLAPRAPLVQEAPWAFLPESTETGCGFEISMSEPQAGQRTSRAFSTTEGTVRKLR